MQLFTVYDDKGEPFEVIPSLAKTLVIINGWSMEAHKPVEPNEPGPVEPAVDASHTVVVGTP